MLDSRGTPRMAFCSQRWGSSNLAENTTWHSTREVDMKGIHFRELLRAASLTLLFSASAPVLSPPLAKAQDTLLPVRVAVGSKAPDFALPSADAKTIRLSQFAGHNVLIDFYRGYW